MRLTLGLALAAGLLAGCGGGDDKGKQPKPPAPPTYRRDEAGDQNLPSGKPAAGGPDLRAVSVRPDGEDYAVAVRLAAPLADGQEVVVEWTGPGDAFRVLSLTRPAGGAVQATLQLDAGEAKPLKGASADGDTLRASVPAKAVRDAPDWNAGALETSSGSYDSVPGTAHPEKTIIR